MAAILPPNDRRSLLERRMSQAPYNSYEMAGLMSGFNMGFRPDPNAAGSATIPFMFESQQDLATQNPSIAPSVLTNSCISQDATNLPLDRSYAGLQDMPTQIHGGSFGSLSWPSATPTQTIASQQGLFVQNGEPNSTIGETYIKSEDLSPIDPSRSVYDAAAYCSSPESGSPLGSADESKPSIFATDIDTLMQAIQSKNQSDEQQAEGNAPNAEDVSVVSRPKKRYICDVPDCGKAFYQKTHLEIHTRAHTGIKPFLCREPSCGQRFSQLGNLKTHERRHTGERPYHCDICGKTFAQHGNVRAHKIVHTSAKPFTCKLDDCNKQFTQLGNLKSHQNKFHVESIRRLKARFENVQDGDKVDSWERDMWEYFTSLYKNCNKGIKGRGKDRRISTTSQPRRDSTLSMSSSASTLTGSATGSRSR